MRSKVKSVTPEMNGAVQNSYHSKAANCTMYTFVVELDNGTRGQVSSKSPAPYRFNVGDDVEATFTPAANPAHTGKLKLDKPDDSHASSNGSANGTAQRGWSPEKEASVKIQGLLKSVIESGIPSEKWEEATLKALAIHDSIHAKQVAPQPAY